MAISLFAGSHVEPEYICGPKPRIGNRGFEILRFVLGLFLLVTAGLKAHGLTVDPLAQDSFLASPRLLVATIEIEIILGLWVLSGWSGRAAWAAMIGFFGILAVVSIYLAVEGQRTCGCFGRVAISPWQSSAIDVVVLGALLLWRPVGQIDWSTTAWIKGFSGVAAGAVLFLMLIVGPFFLAFDNPIEALAYLRDESIVVKPAVADLGNGYSQQTKAFRIELTNRTRNDVRIIGGTSHCSCIATFDLPITLGPGETRSIVVGVKFNGSNGKFQHPYLFYTDDDKQQIVIARFAGRVVDRPD